MKQDDDDPYLFAALKLQDGHTLTEVRKLLISERDVPPNEARSIVLNVCAAQKLQEGCPPSEVCELLCAEKGVTSEEAQSIVAEIRRVREEPSQTGGGSMRGWGIGLLILGIGSFVLPLVGLQFRLLNLFGAATPVLGAILAVIGAVLLALSFRQAASSPHE